ncbi:uncharacterized protein EI90DRAFT_3014082 [Cantharellus anzutake]|uniref:uncharacterized protein n=1 Tax=Cantharellus anzutake TaxID=1750568 RepID=UPI001907AE20|nr:uncharacterized protein EI90DRAFT_3014082 [Cantharellus anzutake]KAF8336277.1 hypothetical protein EI90DRAFT_3014082 [Cantharellus anzutake]
MKSFVTSRQFDLADRFLSPDSPIDHPSMDLSDDANVQDCALYIHMQRRELKEVHLSLEASWRANLLEDKLAGGLFIWINTAFRYVEASAERMMDRLYTDILGKCNWDKEDFVHDYPMSCF